MASLRSMFGAAALAAPALALAAGALFGAGPALSGEAAVSLPPPAVDAAPSGATTAKAVFAGGCFWGVQAVFQHVRGVENAVSGYAGGTVADPTYEAVTTGATGHAEAVEITYDPSQVSYGELLQVFFSVVHNPTQLNYQGPDHGTQYRSAIFYADAEQKRVAEAYLEQIAGAFPAPIVTEIAPLPTFYPAEDYHQDYLINHPESLYIQFNDIPKVENLRRLFPALWRDEPVTVAAAS